MLLYSYYFPAFSHQTLTLIPLNSSCPGMARPFPVFSLQTLTLISQNSSCPGTARPDWFCSLSYVSLF